jgi:CBS domain containing-hemolysin-like protein
MGSLVVTSSNGNVAGIVTVSDLLEMIARRPAQLSKREARAHRDKKAPAWEGE